MLYRFSFCCFVYEICIFIVGSDLVGYFYLILVCLIVKNFLGFEVVFYFEYVFFLGIFIYYEYGKIVISWKEYIVVEGLCYEWNWIRFVDNIGFIMFLGICFIFYIIFVFFF